MSKRGEQLEEDPLVHGVDAVQDALLAAVEVCRGGKLDEEVLGLVRVGQDGSLHVILLNQTHETKILKMLSRLLNVVSAGQEDSMGRHLARSTFGENEQVWTSPTAGPSLGNQSQIPPNVYTVISGDVPALSGTPDGNPEIEQHVAVPPDAYVYAAILSDAHRPRVRKSGPSPPKWQTM